MKIKFVSGRKCVCVWDRLEVWRRAEQWQEALMTQPSLERQQSEKKEEGGLQWTADTLRHTYQEPQTHYEIKRFSEGNLGINQVAWDGLQENTNDAQRF